MEGLVLQEGLNIGQSYEEQGSHDPQMIALEDLGVSEQLGQEILKEWSFWGEDGTELLGTG